MDSEEIFALKTLFYQGSYSAVLALPLPEPPTPAQALYVARAHLALDPPSTSKALEFLSTIDPPTSDSKSVSILAELIKSETDGVASEEAKETAVKEAKELVEALVPVEEEGIKRPEGEKITRVICGTVLARAGEVKDAIGLLKEAEREEDEESIALSVHLHLLLQPPHPSGALALLQSPAYQAFASDSILSQLTRAELDVFTGPSNSYQSAYYAYEEAAAGSGKGGIASRCGRAAAQATQGRWVEAEEAVATTEEETQNPDLLANAVAIALPSGKTLTQAEELFQKLKQLAPNHPLVTNLAEKESLFDSAAARFGTVEA